MGIGWNLENGEIRHAQHPDTFEIPAESERKSLQPGAIIKLRFPQTRGTLSVLAGCCFGATGSDIMDS